jgi:hypothetical protein
MTHHSFAKATPEMVPAWQIDTYLFLRNSTDTSHHEYGIRRRLDGRTICQSNKQMI